MSSQIDTDPLDPVKIRTDIEPISRVHQDEKKALQKRWKLAQNISLAVAVLLFIAPIFFPIDNRPSVEEIKALPNEQVIIYSDPMSIPILKTSDDTALGVTGQPLLLDELIPGYGTEDESGSIDITLDKEGYKSLSKTIPTIELKSKVWPQKNETRAQEILTLNTTDPVSYIGRYLRVERPGFFWGFLLAAACTAGFAYLHFQTTKEERHREKIRQLDKDRDPLTGLSVLGHMVTERKGRGGLSLFYAGVSEEDYQTKRGVRFCRVDQVTDKQEKVWQRESEAYKNLDHPNVVKVYKTQRIGNTFVFIMELIEGEDFEKRLQKLFDQKKTMTAEEAIPIYERIAAGLDHAHQRKIVHRDIKPGNIMLRKDNTPVLIDFGLATDEHHAVTTQMAIKGTAMYMAPEQAQGTDVDRKVEGTADQFAIGVILYEALTAGFPYDRGQSAINMVLERPLTDAKPFYETAPHFGREVSDAIMKMLEKKPEDRYKTCTEAIQAVKVAFEAKLSSGSHETVES